MEISRSTEHTLEAKRTCSTDAGYFWGILILLPPTQSQCTPLGRDLQNKRPSKPKYSCVCTRYSARTFSLNFLPLSSCLWKFITSGRPCSLFELPGSSARGRVAGTTPPALSREGQGWTRRSHRPFPIPLILCDCVTSKGQGRRGCLELETKCMAVKGTRIEEGAGSQN